MKEKSIKLNQPKVSVITICYNPGEDLLPTITSVLAQEYIPIEYLIIDGGSTDGTLAILDAIDDPRIKWISEKDKGIYDAMNKGIRMATGDWLNFMNAGDRFANNTVLKKVAFSNHSDAALLYGKHTKDWKTEIYPNKIEILRYGKIMGCHQSMFFNKSLLKEELIYDPDLILSGDTELVTKIYLQGHKIKFIDQLIAFYKAGGASSNFILKSKMHKYKRVWTTFGLAGVIRVLLMQQKLVDMSRFKIN